MAISLFTRIFGQRTGSRFLTTKCRQSTRWTRILCPMTALSTLIFFPYSDHFYMVYQYQKKSVVYCMAVKMDGNGKRMSEVVQLDSTHLGFAANNKIYSAISSEDK